MAGRLFIRLPEEDDHHEVTWLVEEAEGKAEARAARSPLEDISLHAPGRRVIVLVPASQVLLTRARLPTRKRQRVLAALPYALEDQLAADVETLHFALGRQAPTGELNVAVVARRRLADWLARLRACDIEPDEMIPDVLCLPWQEGAWSALQERDHTLLRTDAQGGVSLDNLSLATLLDLALEEAGEARPARIQWYHLPEAAPPAPPGETALEARPLETDPLELLARHHDPGLGINLLQGEYSRREQLGRYWRPWRLTAALGLTLILLSAAITVGDYVRLRQERDALRQRIERIYLDTFPEARRVVNPRVQMERRLQALRAGGATAAGGFLALLEQAGPVLQATPGLELRRISYRDGHLSIALMIADLQGLDALKARLGEATGLAVEIQSASARDGKVQARLEIREGSS